MKKEIVDILKEYDEFHHSDYNWWSKPDSEQEYIEILREGGKIVSEQDRSEHRWWDELTVIKDFSYADKTFYIGYSDARANRDESVYDLGYYFDKDSIKRYKPKEIKITKYEPVDERN